MRKIYLILIILLLIPSAYAVSSIETVALPTDIKYLTDLKIKYENLPKEFDKVIEHLSFKTLIGNNKSLSVNALDYMSRIYISSQMDEFKDNRLILVKSGIEIVGKLNFGILYTVEGGYLLHIKSKRSGVVAVFLKGFTPVQAEKLKNEILNQTKKTYSQNFYFLQKLFFKSSFAKDANGNTNESFCGSGFAKINGNSTDPTILQQLWSCTKGFSSGIWDSTGGVFSTLTKGTYHVVVDPVGAFNRAVEEFDKLKGLLTDVENAFGDMKSKFQMLPTDIKLKIGCEITGSVGTAGLIAYLTVGGGTPFLYRAIANAILKISNALPKNSILAEKLLKLSTSMSEKAKIATIDKVVKKHLKSFNKDTAQKISTLQSKLQKITSPHSFYGGADLGMGFTEKELLKIKHDDLALYKEIIQYMADEKKLEELRDLQVGTRAVLRSLNIKSAQEKLAITPYMATSACVTKGSIASEIIRGNFNNSTSADTGTK